jgi:hypothetical protein
MENTMLRETWKILGGAVALVVAVSAPAAAAPQPANTDANVSIVGPALDHQSGTAAIFVGEVTVGEEPVSGAAVHLERYSQKKEAWKVVTPPVETSESGRYETSVVLTGRNVAMVRAVAANPPQFREAVSGNAIVYFLIGNDDATLEVLPQDSDGDGLINKVDPDPKNPDADNDGLLDGVDPNPTNPDVDNDGVLDGSDPNPRNPDTDGDGLNDGDDPNPTNPDTDGDGLNDGDDPNPTNPDTDGDGVNDGDDPNPTNPDTDGDGLNDGDDPNPLNPDTDGDGIPDGDDPDPLNPLDPDAHTTDVVEGVVVNDIPQLSLAPAPITARYESDHPTFGKVWLLRDNTSMRYQSLSGAPRKGSEVITVYCSTPGNWAQWYVGSDAKAYVSSGAWTKRSTSYSGMPADKVLCYGGQAPVAVSIATYNIYDWDGVDRTCGSSTCQEWYRFPEPETVASHTG